MGKEERYYEAPAEQFGDPVPCSRAPLWWTRGQQAPISCVSLKTGRPHIPLDDFMDLKY